VARPAVAWDTWVDFHSTAQARLSEVFAKNVDQKDWSLNPLGSESNF
jgi:hypothetical protein